MELAVMVVDKSDPKNPINDAGLPKAGDVLAYKPDGSEWGIEELNHPFWRIIRVPGLTVEQCECLIAPELPTDPKNPSPVLQYRGMKFDLASLDQLSGGVLKQSKTPIALDPKHADTPAIIKATIAAEPTLDSQDVFAIAELKEPLPIPR